MYKKSVIDELFTVLICRPRPGKVNNVAAGGAQNRRSWNPTKAFENRNEALLSNSCSPKLCGADNRKAFTWRSMASDGNWPPLTRLTTVPVEDPMILPGRRASGALNEHFPARWINYRATELEMYTHNAFVSGIWNASRSTGSNVVAVRSEFPNCLSGIRNPRCTCIKKLPRPLAYCVNLAQTYRPRSILFNNFVIRANSHFHSKTSMPVKQRYNEICGERRVVKCQTKVLAFSRRHR